MTTPISTVAYDNSAGRWRNQETGRFVAEASVIGEMRVHQDAAVTNLHGLTSQLYGGSISVEQWQVAAAAEIKDARLAQAMFAVGGKSNMTQANYGRVGSKLQREYRFLDQFAKDIAAGNVSEAQALNRIAQYGNNTQSSYWQEYEQATPEGFEIWWVLGAAEHCQASASGYGCVDMASSSPYEPGSMTAHPGDGGSTCRGNCQCHEERRRIA